MVNVKGIKDFYDDTIVMWADDWYQNTTMFPFLKKVKNMLFPNARVLDLGCNCGYETRRMKDLVLNPGGLDFSDKSINLAKEKILILILFVMICLIIYPTWENLME